MPRGNRQPTPPAATVAAGGSSAVVPYDERREQVRVALLEQQRLMAATAAIQIDPVKMAGLALTHFSRTPGLWDCDATSIARCVLEAAQYGLDMMFGNVYLVPFRNRSTGRREAQLIIGYRGLVNLALRSRDIVRIRGRVVRAKDHFDYGYGLDEHLDHRPHQPRDGSPDELDPGPMTHAYVVAEWADGGRSFDVMTAAEIYAIRARSKGAFDDRGNLTGPWLTDEGEMSKKTVLRRASKMWPLTVEARMALDAEDHAEASAASPVVSTVPDRGRALTERIQAQLGSGDGVPSAPAASGQPDDESGARPAGSAGGGGPSAPPPADPPAKAETAASVDVCGATSPYTQGEYCPLPVHAKGTPHGDDKTGTWL